MMGLKKLIFVVIFMLAPFLLAASDTVEPQVLNNDENKSIFSVLDKPSQNVSSQVTRITNRIDSFFSNEKVYYESTGSFLRLKADMVWDEEADKIGFAGDVRLKLNLSRSKEKYKFVFESDPERSRDEVDSEIQSDPVKAADEAEYYAGIQKQGGDKKKWLYRTTLGVKVRTPLDFFVRSRASRIYPFESWSMRLDEGVFWFDSLGVGADSSVEFDHALNDNSLFRARTYLRWLNDNEYFEPSEVLSIYHTLSQRKVLAYQAGVYAVTKPTVEITDYAVTLRYRQDIHAQLLFLEIIPQILFTRDHNFHPDHSIIFRLEWVFNG